MGNMDRFQAWELRSVLRGPRTAIIIQVLGNVEWLLSPHDARVPLCTKAGREHQTMKVLRWWPGLGCLWPVSLDLGQEFQVSTRTEGHGSLVPYSAMSTHFP